MSASVSGFGAAFGAKFVFVTALLPGMAPNGSVFCFKVLTLFENGGPN
jgi:hypothetical protein